MNSVAGDCEFEFRSIARLINVVKFTALVRDDALTRNFPGPGSHLIPDPTWLDRAADRNSAMLSPIGPDRSRVIRL